MLVPSSVSGTGAAAHQYASSYLLNDTVVIDAGSIGYYGAPKDQARVRHVLLTHSHIDHVGSLPIFVENSYEGKADSVIVYGSDAVLDVVQKDIFNDRVWPDFPNLSRPEAPFLRLARLEAYRPVECDGLRLTPVPVDHVVPTFGFLVEDAHGAVMFSSDTGPTEAIWQAANRLAHLKAVFLEVTFPDSMAQLAEVSKHLTPATFAREVAKLRVPARVIAVHIKPTYYEQVVAELLALGLPNIEIRQVGHSYHF
jgi:ribonuclease BN (tRNA processing enzyme)